MSTSSIFESIISNRVILFRFLLFSTWCITLDWLGSVCLTWATNTCLWAIPLSAGTMYLDQETLINRISFCERSKMSKFATKKTVLLQMPPKVIWGSPMTKMFKICILGRSKMPKSEKNCSRCSKICIFGGKKFKFGRLKMPKFSKKFFLLQKSLGGLTWPKFAKFAYLEGQKCPFGGVKSAKFWKDFFCSKCPKSCVLP